MSTPVRHIRNFAIIAHIDHGKSTLADRLIERCNGLGRDAQEQMLDTMSIERERGITIKAQTVRLHHKHRDGNQYVLNLIDTPGHVDFTYEVNRSLASCEGSLLVVDAAQGVEAQTLANVDQAIENDHEIITVLNKTDLPAAEPERVGRQIEDLIGLPAADAIPMSAKSGENVDKVLDAIIERLPPPKPSTDARLKAMLIDSWYDSFLGVIVLVRILDGNLEAGRKIRMMGTGASATVDAVGVFMPRREAVKALGPGEIGYFTAGIKDVRRCRVGDTITDDKTPTDKPHGAFRPLQPLVFCGLYPEDNGRFAALRAAMEKLSLNDGGFTFAMETSNALGLGYRCGFLGLLHLEIVRERLEREFDLSLITTAPSVIYRLDLTDDSQLEMHNPADMPDATRIARMNEPWIKATILAPERDVGALITLCQERRGVQSAITYIGRRVMLTYELPLNEVIFDFHDRIKSLSSGYASFDYQLTGYREGDLVKMSILVNGEPVDALATFVHRMHAERRGRSLCEKLKDLIPQHMFQVPIQAAIGGRIIARETVRALRKDVTAKCYGGDVTRKRKLLERQREGKRKMKQYGKVEIPHDAFIKALKSDG